MFSKKIPEHSVLVDKPFSLVGSFLRCFCKLSVKQRLPVTCDWLDNVGNEAFTSFLLNDQSETVVHACEVVHPSLSMEMLP